MSCHQQITDQPLSDNERAILTALANHSESSSPAVNAMSVILQLPAQVRESLLLGGWADVILELSQRDLIAISNEDHFATYALTPQGRQAIGLVPLSAFVEVAPSSAPLLRPSGLS